MKVVVTGNSAGRDRSRGTREQRKYERAIGRELSDDEWRWHKDRMYRDAVLSERRILDFDDPD